MKKIFFCLVVLIGLIFGSTQSIIANAPTYLNGDQNWQLAWERYDIDCYVQVDSVQVIRYAPPIYIIEANVAIAPHRAVGYRDASNIHRVRYIYYYDMGRVIEVNTNNGEPIIQFNARRAQSGNTYLSAQLANKLFRLCYNMNF